MNRFTSTYLTFFIFLLSGCITTRFAQIGDAYPEYRGIVKVLDSVPENTEYVEIGILSSKGGSYNTDAGLIKALQKKAAKKGAIAIVIVSDNQSNQVGLSLDGDGVFFGNKRIIDKTVLAIRLLE